MIQVSQRLTPWFFTEAVTGFGDSVICKIVNHSKKKSYVILHIKNPYIVFIEKEEIYWTARNQMCR